MQRKGPNEIIRHGRLVFIKLTRGKWAIIDAGDYIKVSKYRWYAHTQYEIWYACMGQYSGDKHSTVGMHKLICPTSLHVDHRNGNGLDNRRKNLRPATHAENQQNAHIRSDNTSGCKGVYYASKESKWKAQIRINGARIRLGTFATKQEAKAAYDLAALNNFGEFSRIK